MALGHGTGDALQKAVELYNTVSYTNDENGQPVKNPTDDERKQLKALLEEAIKELGKK